jgi:hypothetical protein
MLPGSPLSVSTRSNRMVSLTYLNTFAFLATELYRCTTAGAMMIVCYQERRVVRAYSVGKAMLMRRRVNVATHRGELVWNAD